MSNFVTGWNFGATEQVTNTKLNAIVNSAAISNILSTELASSILSSLTSVQGYIAPYNLAKIVDLATNTSIPDVSRGTVFNYYQTTYATLASISNAFPGHRFTFIAQQASTPIISDSGSFKLEGNWIPAKQYDNITLVWTGSVFVETGRVST